MTQIHKIKYDFFGILIHKDIKKIISNQRYEVSASSAFHSSKEKIRVNPRCAAFASSAF